VQSGREDRQLPLTLTLRTGHATDIAWGAYFDVYPQEILTEQDLRPIAK